LPVVSQIKLFFLYHPWHSDKKGKSNEPLQAFSAWSYTFRQGQSLLMMMVMNVDLPINEKIIDIKWLRGANALAY
jgi:hypothetical protein